MTASSILATAQVSRSIDYSSGTGFGHFVYRSGDPRAVVLLGLVRRAAPRSGQLAVAEAVLAEVRRKSLPEPNIDFAVGTLARVAGMVPGAGEAVFAVARTAGWIAHALEAYAGGGPLRPRAVYTGPPAIIDPWSRGRLLPIRDLASQREA